MFLVNICFTLVIVSYPLLRSTSILPPFIDKKSSTIDPYNLSGVSSVIIDAPGFNSLTYFLINLSESTGKLVAIG